MNHLGPVWTIMEGLSVSMNGGKFELAHSMVPGFQQVDVPDDGGDAVLVAAASLEVRSQVRGVTERVHLAV